MSTCSASLEKAVGDMRELTLARIAELL